ncbi:MAG TPA: shikimate kinase [Candidatus Acidoferrum sp.]|nr:shikimate kinase [Candidatus Acidoferrum sp.]
MPGSQVHRVVLVGLMGSGKTTVGAALAARLGWSFRDSDAEILQRTGRTVRVLHDELGVDGMHELEERQLIDALADPEPSVVAAAASTIDMAACRAALVAPGVAVVWLRGSAAVLAHRFASEGHRPVYGEDPAEFLASQAAVRDPLFDALGPLVVAEVDRDAPDRIVDAILAALAER